MRDQQFNRITNVEKPINNEFTKKGKYALIEITDGESYPDAKIRGKQMLYANIVKIDDNLEDLQFFAKKSDGNFHVIETRNLEPQDQPIKVKRKMDKLNKAFSKRDE